MLELPNLDLLIGCSRKGVIDLVESIHVELTDKALPVRMLEPAWKDDSREFGWIGYAEGISSGTPCDHGTRSLIFQHRV